MSDSKTCFNDCVAAVVSAKTLAAHLDDICWTAVSTILAWNQQLFESDDYQLLIEPRLLKECQHLQYRHCTVTVPMAPSVKQLMQQHAGDDADDDNQFAGARKSTVSDAHQQQSLIIADTSSPIGHRLTPRCCRFARCRS